MYLLLFSHQVMPNSFVTPWTIAHQAPLSMGFPRQDYWSGLPFLSPGDLPDPGIEPMSSALQADFFLPLSHLGSMKALDINYNMKDNFHKMVKYTHFQKCF